MKKIFLILFVLLVNLQADKKLHVATTIYPVYDALKNIAGADVTIDRVIPFSQDVHEFSPTPKDVIKIVNVDIFFYSGAGLDDFLLRFRDKKLAYDLSEGLKLHEADEDEHHHHGEHEDEEDVDAHYWLDIDLYIEVVKKIAAYLVNADKVNAATYNKRANAYVKELQELKKRYATTLKECKNDTVVVNHNAYGYLAQEYDFKVHSLAGASSHARGSAKNMKEAIEHLKGTKNPIIFGEPFGSNRAIETVAAESGAKVKTLETLANVTKKQENESYISLMQNNLALLKEALDCK